MSTPNHQNALSPVSLKVAGTDITGFSISGVATWMLVPQFDAMFDVGECPLESVSTNNVFLTHAHGDHSRCLLRHWQLRRMFNMNEATYFVPASAVDGFRDIVRIEARMEGVAESEEILFPNFKVIPTDLSQVPLKKGTWVQAFEVEHRAPSVGYTIGRTVQRLRAEYSGLTGPEIGALRMKGVTISDPFEVPQITFIGDCTGATLEKESHIWKSKVVVIECTYVEPGHEVNAVANTHTHLSEIVRVLQNHTAPECEALVLKHFSLKTSPARVRELVRESVPAEWADRVHILLP